MSLIGIFLAVLVFDLGLKSVAVRSDGPAREAAIRFHPVRIDGSELQPLRLVGAWKVEVDDPRFGGVSAMAFDAEALLAITDSGSVIRLPKPGNGGRAFVRDLPVGPDLPQFKVNRDSEALASDPAGRGWWVAFEFWHQLWLYDEGFRRALGKIDLGEDRWRDNRGIEALVAEGGGLLLFPESGGEWLQLGANGPQHGPMRNAVGAIADGVRLQDGRLLLVTRRIGLSGIDKHLVEARRVGDRMSLRPIAALKLGPKENVEAIAAEARAAGGTRLWLMTDNDFRPRKATLLVAVDLP